jgi:hypothetical protein
MNGHPTHAGTRSSRYRSSSTSASLSRIGGPGGIGTVHTLSATGGGRAARERPNPAQLQ